MIPKIIRGALLIIISFTLLSFFDFDPEAWSKAGSAPDKYKMETEKGAGQNGKDAETIQSLSRKIKGFGTLMKSRYMLGKFDFAGKRVRMTGLVKSKDVKTWAGMWFRVDKQHAKESLAFDNMSSRAIKGTTDWKKYEIVLDVPKDATAIAFGVLLYGTGQIWFDDISFEVVDSLTPSTDMNIASIDGWSRNNGAEKYNMTVEKGTGKDGKDAVTIQSKEKKITGQEKFHSKGLMYKQLKPETYAGKRVRMICNMKSQDVNYWGSINIIVVPKKDNQLIWLGKFHAIKKTKDWQKFEVVFDVPANVTGIQYGASLSGSGQIWFDFSEPEIVDETVPITFKAHKVRY